MRKLNIDLKKSKYYHQIVILVSLLLIISNLAEIKVVSLVNLTFGAGTIFFPLLYVINDLVTEI